MNYHLPQWVMAFMSLALYTTPGYQVYVLIFLSELTCRIWWRWEFHGLLQMGESRCQGSKQVTRPLHIPRQCHWGIWKEILWKNQEWLVWTKNFPVFPKVLCVVRNGLHWKGMPISCEYLQLFFLLHNFLNAGDTPYALEQLFWQSTEKRMIIRSEKRMALL